VALSGVRNPVVHLMHEQDSAARASVRFALRRARGILAVGSASAEAYRAALPHATVGEVNNFLSVPALAALLAVRDRAAPREPGHPPALGVLARLIPEKGVGRLVAELSEVPEAWSRLTIAGARQDEAYARSVEAEIAGRSLSARVSLDRPTAAVDDFLAGIDVLVVPSTGREGQPTVILEALAAGLPVVVRRPLATREFDRLPVVGYDDPTSLEAALGRAHVRADPEVLVERFGIEQLLAGIDAAAAAIRPRRW
jgi:glycosyltransferase involved in cell wall biosynthesis